jgi:hypothetical protein
VKTPALIASRDQWLTAAGSVAFLFIGLWLAGDSVGVPALKWGGIWRETDFKTGRDIIDFYRHLRTGVPPFIALIELLHHVQFDRLDWLLTSVFRLFFVLTFMLPFLFFARSRIHRFIVFLTCLVFFASAVAISASNQQVYDVYYPFFVLAFLVSVRLAQSTNKIWALSAACLAVGFFMSMIELSRPFALLLVPILALHAGFALWHLKRRYFLLMLLPVLVLSGGWHVKMFVMHDGQIFWSNNGGYNLYRNWKTEMDEEPVLLGPGLPENQRLREDPFPGTGKLAGFAYNSEFHTRNSKILQAAVFDHFQQHPISSVDHLLENIAALYRPQLVIFRMIGDEPLPPETLRPYEPKQPVIKVYPFFVWIAAAVVLANCLAMLAYLLTHRRLDFIRDSGNCLSLVIAATTLALALGERGEEARFLISLLPLLAVLPFGFEINRDRSGGIDKSDDTGGQSRLALT